MNLNKVKYTQTLALDTPQDYQPIRAYAEQANTIEVLAPVSGFNTAYAVLQGLRGNDPNPALQTTERLFMSPLSDSGDYKRWNFVIPGPVLNDNTLANSTGLRFKVEFWYTDGDFLGVEKYNTEVSATIKAFLAVEYPAATDGQLVRVIDTDTDWYYDLDTTTWVDYLDKKLVGITKEVTQVVDFTLEQGVYTGEPSHAVSNTELIISELNKKLAKAGDTMTGDLDMDGNDIDQVASVTLYNALGTAVLTYDGTELNINIGSVDYTFALKDATNTFSEINTFTAQILANAGIDINSQKLVSLASGTVATDAVNKGQLDLKADITYVDAVGEALDIRVTTAESDIDDLETDVALKVYKSQSIMGIDFEDNITRTEVVNAIGEATQILSGLMSVTDKTRLDALHALLGVDADADAVTNTINEVLAIFDQYPEGADLVSTLNGKVDKIAGKQLSTNDLTDTLKDHYDTAYTHSQVTDGTNPHATKFIDLLSKPITIDGFGITDAYDKDYIDQLEDFNGWQSTLLTPTALVSTDTILTATLAAKDKLTFICKNTTTGEIDTDELVGSSIVTGAKLVFFDNAAVYFTVGATDST
nr:hypothetical protein [Thiomicrorhabdus sp.]